MDKYHGYILEKIAHKKQIKASSELTQFPQVVKAGQTQDRMDYFLIER